MSPETNAPDAGKIITIHINKVESSGFGAFVAEWTRVLNIIYSGGTGNKYIIDFSICGFLSPFMILPLDVMVDGLIKDGYSITYEIPSITDLDLKSYLGYIHFPGGVRPDTLSSDAYELFLETYNTKRYIPIVSLPEARDSEFRNSEIRDQFQSCIHSLICRQCNLEGNMKSAVLYLIDEAMNNISEHSLADRGFVFAQYYPTLSCLHVAIADSGITIKGSYNNAGKTEIDKSSQAIELAITGVSTKTIHGRGFGIRTSKKMLVDGLGGSYLLFSGNAFNLHIPGRNEIVETPVHFQGTCLLLKIPLNPKPEFNYIGFIE